MIAELTLDDFDGRVLGSESPVFVCFTASHCRPCFALRLILDDLAKEYSGAMKFVMIDVEKEPQLAARYNITPLPTAILFRHGKPLKKLLGFQSKHYLKAALTAELGHTH